MPNPILAKLQSTPCVTHSLGIVFLDDEVQADCVRATMPVDERTCQPYGFLSGASSLALAECLAGYGSALLLPLDLKPVGVNVSATHVAAVPVGDTVLGIAKILHKGRTNHLWNVDIFNSDHKLISTARVLNQIIPVVSLPKSRV